jgi:hypothetical protein
MRATTSPVWIEQSTTLLEVYRRALRTYFARFPIVTGIAVAVYGPLAMLTTVIAQGGIRYNERHPDNLGLLVFFATTAGTSVVLFGSAFYAGFLDKVVGEHQHGHHRHTVGEILRTLPYRRLLAAELILTVATLVGLLLFVVPGLVVFTLFCLVGPLITIEGQTVLGAFRRSAQLIWPVFLMAFTAVTMPIVIEHSLAHSIEHYVLHHPGLLLAFVLHGLMAATVGAFVGLVEVTLTFMLIHRHSEMDAAG